MRPRSDQRGAVAIVMALTVTLLLIPLAALAVDLGNAYQRKGAVQSQTDLAALAAAASLPDKAAALDKVCESVGLNRRIGQLNGEDGSDLGCVPMTSTTLDADPACPTTAAVDRQPFVYFFANNPYRIKVCSPPAKVDFGFAAAIPDVASTMDVLATATVTGGTPGGDAMMPYYGVGGSGCDWGPQALTDPAPGKVTSTPPPLAAPLTGLVKQNIVLYTITPSQVDVGAAGVTMRVTGKQLQKVDRVGFFREPTESPNRFEPAALPSQGDSTGGAVLFTLPPEVANQEGLWYVRLHETGNNAAQTGWSKDALAVRVGEALIQCPALSNSGNFGALTLPRTDSNNSTSGGWMPNNIADGLQAPLSIAVHKEAVAPYLCSAGGPGVVYSRATGTPTLTPGTNCLMTDTGLTATATTAGLITGTPLFPGRLTKRPTSTGVVDGRSCAPDKSASNRVVAGRSINDDTLTCFLTNPNTRIAEIASPGYAGPVALDAAIYNSPRFCYVPIIGYDPAMGRSQSYSVIDVRPCFITGESATSTWNSRQWVDGSGDNNGVTMNSTGNRVETLGVVFLNRNALPNEGVNLGDYVGVGPMAVQLVD